MPLFWVLLPNKGNSNTTQRQQLIDRLLSVFGVEKIGYLTADREFRGRTWLQYLVDQRIPFCLRIPHNTKVWNRHKNQQMKVSRLFCLRQKEQMSLNKQRTIWGRCIYRVQWAQKDAWSLPVMTIPKQPLIVMRWDGLLKRCLVVWKAVVLIWKKPIDGRVIG